MKKILLSLLVTLFAFSAYAGDMPIQPSQLPDNSKSFISKTFNGAQIIAAKKDLDSYEAALNNGVKIEFLMNGEWKSIESYSILPAGILPQKVEAAANQQGSGIIEIEKDFGYYEIKLQNNLELKIDFNGKIISKKMD